MTIYPGWTHNEDTYNRRTNTLFLNNTTELLRYPISVSFWLLSEYEFVA
jgi:hypothetical protein